MRKKSLFVFLGLLSGVFVFAFFPSPAAAQTVFGSASTFTPSVGVPVSITVTAFGFADPSPNTFRVDCTDNGTWEGTSSLTSLNQWIFNNVCTYSTSGSVTIRFEMADDADFAENAFTITVAAAPAITVTASVNDSTPDIGQDVIVTANVAGGPSFPITYELDCQGDGIYEASESGNFASHPFAHRCNYATSGDKPITVRATDDLANSDTGIVHVNVNPAGGNPPTNVTMSCVSCLAGPIPAGTMVTYTATAQDDVGVVTIVLEHNIGSGWVTAGGCPVSPPSVSASCVGNVTGGYLAGTTVLYRAKAFDATGFTYSPEGSFVVGGSPSCPATATGGCISSVACATAGGAQGGSCAGGFICCTLPIGPAACASPNTCEASCSAPAAGTCPAGTGQCCAPGGGGPPGGGPPVGGGPGPGTVIFENPLGSLTFTGLINNIINFIFTIAVILAPILLVIAGVIFMTAAGDPGKVKTARNMMLWTIVGFGVILISKGLVGVLKGILEI